MIWSKRESLSATGIYLFFAGLIYWPVLFGRRFFWEDFTNQEYPLRDYAFTSLGIFHHLPLWNPYSWPWAASISDPQMAIWYPTNLLQIYLTRWLIPSAQHLPVLVPEIFTILHFPLAALGMYLLVRRRYQLQFLPALIAGFVFGFGTKMIAEQNHQMEMYQWALLPWIAQYMLRSLDEWRYTFIFALLLGVSYLAGGIQISLFNSTFLLCWFGYELFQRKKEGVSVAPLGKLLLVVSSALLLALLVSAPELIPSFELSRLTARASLTYQNAGQGSLKFPHLLNFFVPKLFGEYSSTNDPGTLLMLGSKYDYWEAAFSWTVFGELLTAFAIWRLWRFRNDRAKASVRDLKFLVAFGIFAILFGLGPHVHVQWLFWKFVPLFGQARGPMRMAVYFWFGGTILTGIGLQELISAELHLERSRKFLLLSLIPFAALSLAGTLGIFGLMGGQPLMSTWYLSLPTLLCCCLIALYLLLIFKRGSSSRLIAAGAVGLILLELYFNDFTWHRNTVNPQDQFEAAMNSHVGIVARDAWALHTTKTLTASNRTEYLVHNAGMYARLPIEPAGDSVSALFQNPMRLSRSWVPAKDSELARKIMGISEVYDTEGGEHLRHIEGALPFLHSYTRWIGVNDDAETARLLYRNDSTGKEFDYQNIAIIQGADSHSDLTDSASIADSRIAEDSISCTVTASGRTMLLVNDLFYQKWRAEVDGKPAPIYRAFTALRAVAVPAGQHRVLLYYDDRSVVFGMMVSGTSVAICLMGFLAGRNRRRKAVAAKG